MCYSIKDHWFIVPKGRNICRTNDPSVFKLRRNDIKTDSIMHLRNFSFKINCVDVFRVLTLQFLLLTILVRPLHVHRAPCVARAEA